MNKTITTTREYDDEGRMVKETVVEQQWEPVELKPVPQPWDVSPPQWQPQIIPNTGTPIRFPYDSWTCSGDQHINQIPGNLRAVN